MPACPCPFCGVKLDAAGNSIAGSTERPRPGIVSLCMKCGEWIVFDDKLMLRKPTDEEYELIAVDENAHDLRRGWLSASAEWAKATDAGSARPPDDE